MRYLQSQLGRLSSCCEQVERLGAYVEDMRGALTTMQDKVVNLAQLLDHEHNFVDASIQDLSSCLKDVDSKQVMFHDLFFGKACKVYNLHHLSTCVHTHSQLITNYSLTMFSAF